MKQNRGFTLVELLAVIVILGILFLIAVPSINKIIENSKRQAFIADCKAYLQAAKYNNNLDNTTENKYFNIKSLEVKNHKQNYLGGILYFDLDEDGIREYYIYIYDKENGISLGNNEFEKLKFVSEKEISTSNLSVVPERFSNLVENSLKNENYISGAVDNFNFEFNTSTAKLYISKKFELGDVVYVPSGNFCRPMSVLSNTINNIVLFDPTGKNMEIEFSEVREQIAYLYSDYSIYADDLELIRLFSVNDLYYFVDFDKYGFTVELFEANKENIAKLFSPLYYSSFYETEYFNSISNRFISLGDNSDKDRCRADGSLGPDPSMPCYRFSLQYVYNGQRPEIMQYNSRDKSFTFYNFVITIRNADKYIGYDGDIDEDGKLLNAKKSCQKKLSKLLSP